jgi:phenylacetate-CoA ligase
MNLFKIILSLKGYPISKASRRLKSINSLEPFVFNNSVDKLLKKQFKFLLTNNSIFRKINGSNTDYHSSVIIQKSNLQGNIKENLSDGFTMKNTFSNSTSGSSGIPLKFAKDKFAHAMTWALIFDRYSWYDIEYGKSLQARFFGIPLNGIEFYKESLKDFISCRVRFPVFDLSEEKLESFLKCFKKKKFDYINGYTSSLVYFARYCIEKKVILQQVCPSLKVCFPTSELCTEDDRKILEEGFGVRVAIEYGCAEMDVLAFEDPDGDMILSNENVYFEVVDDQGRRMEDGQVGRLILTSLHNKAMPLYRYEIGDIGSISKRKKGCYQILEKLNGRTNEFAILSNGRKVPALTFYYITKTLLQKLSDVKEVVVHQIDAITFRFVYVSNSELNDITKEAVQIALNKYIEPGLKAEFLKKDHIQRTKSGKLKQFERHYNVLKEHQSF